MPLSARAVWTKKAPGLLSDPKAVEVVEALDYDFSQFRTSFQTQIGCVLRTLQYDAWVRDFLTRHPTGTVVEIGAGLNSRFERTDNGTAQFIELDLPDAMALRRRFFAETDRRSQLAGSVLEDDWLAPVQATGGPYLFVIEGVLMYFAEADVRRLLTRLSAGFPGAQLAFDALTHRGVAEQHRMTAMKNLDAKFDWGIDEIRSLETWGDGITCLDAVNLRTIALRNKHRLPWMLLLIAAGMATVKRKSVEDYWMALFQLSAR